MGLVGSIEASVPSFDATAAMTTRPVPAVCGVIAGSAFGFYRGIALGEADKHIGVVAHGVGARLLQGVADGVGGAGEPLAA